MSSPELRQLYNKRVRIEAGAVKPHGQRCETSRLRSARCYAHLRPRHKPREKHPTQKDEA